MTVVVGTAAYFSCHVPPAASEDLTRPICVNYRLLGGGGLLPWKFECAECEIRQKVTGQLIVNDEVRAATAVRAGAGLGYMMEHDVAEEIADDRLVQVLAPWCPSYRGCRLYYPDRRVTLALGALIGALRIGV